MNHKNMLIKEKDIVREVELIIGCDIKIKLLKGVP
jgi:hypothetical protein